MATDEDEGPDTARAGRMVLGLVLAAAVLSAFHVITTVGRPLALCESLPPIQAPADAFRDLPVYDADSIPLDAVQAWATDKRGFEAMWVDWNHHGWIVAAFSRDVEVRRFELATVFPGAGIVAIEVDWTYRQLDALKDRVSAESRDDILGVGIRPDLGAIAITVDDRRPDKIEDIRRRYAGERGCYELGEPAVGL